MPVPDTLICAVSPGETRLALLSGDLPVELAVVRRGQALGGIWLGRVIASGRGGAFVDIGLARPGWLAEPAGEGAAVMVQAVVDPRVEKGAQLVTAISLTGRRLALSPMRPGVAVSRRLDAAERARLLEIGRALATPGEGLVLRTAARGIGAEDLAKDLALLRGQWQRLQAISREARPPVLLMPPDAVGRLLVDNPSVTKLVVDDPEAYADMRQVHRDVVVERSGDVAELCDEFIAAALTPRVPLPCGGALIIEETAAAVLIDVDAGAAAADVANAEAVAEVARLLRLRNLCGHILVDLIPGKHRRRREQWLEGLRTAVAQDPTPTHVVGVTPLGMVELTRERRRPSLAELMCERRWETSTDTAALAALRVVLREAMARPAGAVRLTVAPEVAAALARQPAAVADVERRLARPVSVVAEEGRPRDRHDIDIG